MPKEPIIKTLEEFADKIAEDMTGEKVVSFGAELVRLNEHNEELFGQVQAYADLVEECREELALVVKQRDDIAETAQQRIDELENIVAAYEQYDQ